MADAGRIMALETRFWQALVDGDAQAAAALLAPNALSVSMSGIQHYGPEAYAAMAEEAPAKLVGFSFSEESVDFPLPRLAIAAYRAEQRVCFNGKTHAMVVFNSTTWLCSDGQWQVVAHTQSPWQDGLPADWQE